MTPAARLSAAIEVLGDIFARRRPAPDALKDWGLGHRFAGSGDRAAIASLVYDALRRKSSAAWLMGQKLGEETPRAVLLGALLLARGLSAAEIAGLCDGSRFAPEPLSEQERAALAAADLADAPAHVAADFPEWLAADLARSLGEALSLEGRALAGRAPLDLRVNVLVATRLKLLEQLEHLSPAPTPRSPWGIRIPLGADGRGPSVQAEPSFLKGAFEVQDEGSQLAALLAGAEPGTQVADLCAGAGGKTLELAAAMNNTGQLFATDADKRRLVPIHDRLTRAQVRNVQVRTPRTKDDEPLAGLEGKLDLVLVDAPCTGSGTWRRNPDAKWRIRPGALAERTAEQAAILERAARFVKPGGRLVYVTCSLLPQENGDQIRAFRAAHRDFSLVDPADMADAANLAALADHRDESGQGILMTPARTGTDGFFVAMLRKNG